MARHLGDPDAAEYARLYASGRARYDRELWNGEYYEQHVRMPEPHEVQKGKYPQRHPPAIREGEDTPRYQYGPGCLSDQLLGQWFAHVVGLGHLLPADHVRTAAAVHLPLQLPAVLVDHESCQRTYALNEEGAVLLCTWPRGGRPRYPFPYADEVLDRHRVPGRRPPDLRGAGRGGARDRARGARPPRRRPAQPVGRVRVRPPLRAGALVLVAPPRALGLPVQRTGPAAPLRAARGGRRVPQLLHGRHGLGHGPDHRASRRSSGSRPAS